MDSPLWVGARLLQPLRPAGQLHRRGRRVGADPLQGEVHGGLGEPEPHAALEAVPFIGGTVVRVELRLLWIQHEGYISGRTEWWLKSTCDGCEGPCVSNSGEEIRACNNKNFVTNLGHLQLQEERVDEAEFAQLAAGQPGASVLCRCRLRLAARCKQVHWSVLDVRGTGQAPEVWSEIQEAKKKCPLFAFLNEICNQDIVLKN